VQNLFIIISTLLALTSPIFYIHSILKGKTKPHRTTRFILLLDTLLSTAALYAVNDRVAIWLAGVSALQAIVLFILSIKYGMGGWAKSDIACLLIALGGIVLWQTTDNPLLALWASILADFVGMIPALIKTWRFPHLETWTFFAMDTVAGIFTMLAISTRTFHNTAYPLYIFAINLTMVLLILRPTLRGGRKTQ
jgi:hypothetical protein